jgi:hypothetical protein
MSTALHTERYRFTNGSTMEREVAFPYRWELRDRLGVLVERDKYRHDLIERHRLEIEEHVEGGLDD